jgi:hypothetical protein
LSFSGVCSDGFAVETLSSVLSGEEIRRAEPVLAADAAGDSFATALDLGVLQGTKTVSGFVGWGDQRDLFRFELRGEAEVELALAGLRQDIDLYLYDAGGRQLGRSIQPGPLSESFTGSLGAGTYYVLVAPYRNHASSYRLTLKAALETVPPDGAGNSFSDARELGSLRALQTFRDWVGPEDPADYYRFELDREGDVEVVLNGLEEDIDLYLFSADGRQIARSWNGGSVDESVRQFLSAGEYVVLVEPWGAAKSGYSLALQADLGQPSPNPTPDPTPDPGGDGPFPDVDDFGGANDWNLNSINAPEVWAAGFTGEGVVVAVVDTGIDASHRELSSSIWLNQDEVAGNGVDDDANGFVDDTWGWDFASGDNNPTDLNGHGTHVAGTIAAANDGFGATGVAFDATIMPVRVLDADGMGSIFDVAAGIRYAVDNGADVINLSLGGGYSSALGSALSYAQQHGVFVVAAAGNGAAAAPAYPAAFSASLTNVLSVGAHDSGDAVASFTNRVGGSGAVQVAAPGVNIYSSLPGNRYGYLSGTSMATPHVAGLAALALSANPSLAPETLRTLVVDGADRPIAGSDSHGGVNSAATVASALGYTATSANQASTASSGATFNGPDGLAADQVFAESRQVPDTNRRLGPSDGFWGLGFL